MIINNLLNTIDSLLYRTVKFCYTVGEIILWEVIVRENKSFKLGLVSLIYILIAIFSSFAGSQIFIFAAIMIPTFYFALRYDKKLSTKETILAIVLANIASIYGFIVGDTLQIVIIIFMTGFSLIASIGIFKEFLGDNKLLNKNRLKTLAIGGVMGLILGFINLKISDIDPNPKFILEHLLMALRAGIWEEVAARFIFYALGVYILKGEAKTKFEKVLLYIIMIIPHILSHGMLDLPSIIILFIFFGFPLAMLQRKLDLTSAIICHTLIDLIRFITFGA